MRDSLTLIVRPPFREQTRIDCRMLDPVILSTQTPEQIGTLEVNTSAGKFKASELFDIEDGLRDSLTFEPHGAMLDFVGCALTKGEIKVAGTAGDFLGQAMRGGQIFVSADCGDCTAERMRGGTIVIDGNVGDYLAAATPGKRHGMSGGICIVRGNAGRWAAARMKRGLLIIEGETGQGTAARLIAGTIALGGKGELQTLGAGMKRGTIIRFAPNTPEPVVAPPGFTDPEQNELSFLPLLLREICKWLRRPDSVTFDQKKVWRSLGDRSTDGLGELIWLNVKPDSESEVH